MSYGKSIEKVREFGGMSLKKLNTTQESKRDKRWVLLNLLIINDTDL